MGEIIPCTLWTTTPTAASEQAPLHSPPPPTHTHTPAPPPFYKGCCSPCTLCYSLCLMVVVCLHLMSRAPSLRADNLLSVGAIADVSLCLPCATCLFSHCAVIWLFAQSICYSQHPKHMQILWTTPIAKIVPPI